MNLFKTKFNPFLALVKTLNIPMSNSCTLHFSLKEIAYLVRNCVVLYFLSPQHAKNLDATLYKYFIVLLRLILCIFQDVSQPTSKQKQSQSLILEYTKQFNPINIQMYNEAVYTAYLSNQVSI